MESDPPTEVVEGIFIGSISSVKSGGMASIDAIINLSGRCYETNKAMINIVMDDTNVDLESLDTYVKKFTIGVAAIEAARKESRSVLVHCAAGINRSATLIAFYLIEQGYSYDETLRLLSAANKKRGVELLTNPTFKSILKTHYILRKNFAGRNEAFQKLSK